MHKVLNEILNDFIAREGIIAAALFGTDGLVIEAASHQNIDMDRVGALFGIYFANTANQSQDIRILHLPKHEKADYVLLANVSGALFALFTNTNFANAIFTNETPYDFVHDIQKIKVALSMTQGSSQNKSVTGLHALA